jgi:hypothetical protein
METTVNLDRIRPERLAGYATNYLGDGWLERAKGTPLRDRPLRATVYLNDEEARKAIDWIIDNLGHPFPFSFTDVNRIVGVEAFQEQPARV